MTLQPIKGAVNIPFSRQRYDAADTPAKDKIISYLKANGHTILDATEDFSVDIKSQKEDNTYFSEVEIKYAWRGDWNPRWEEIRIPYRKHKLINRVHSLENKPFFNFYILRKDLQYAWRIKDFVVEESEVKEAKGRNILKGEHFFHIPVNKAELVKL
jgi:hypothetical protein